MKKSTFIILSLSLISNLTPNSFEIAVRHYIAGWVSLDLRLNTQALISFTQFNEISTKILKNLATLNNEENISEVASKIKAAIPLCCYKSDSEVFSIFLNSMLKKIPASNFMTNFDRYIQESGQESRMEILQSTIDRTNFKELLSIFIADFLYQSHPGKEIFERYLSIL